MELVASVVNARGVVSMWHTTLTIATKPMDTAEFLKLSNHVVVLFIIVIIIITAVYQMSVCLTALFSIPPTDISSQQMLLIAVFKPSAVLGTFFCELAVFFARMHMKY